MDRPARVIVVYNTDYQLDETSLDESSVEGSAAALHAALQESGYIAERMGVQGRDVFEVLQAAIAWKPDLVFNLCESLAGEARHEPTFVGLLDLLGLAYTGTDLLGLASCLHKQRAKEILTARGVATPPYRYLEDPAALDDPELDALDYPWFVKLAHEDASVGITEDNLVRTPDELRTRARALMLEFQQGVLAERFVDGREVNVTLIGNGGELAVLPLHEIDFAAMPRDRPRIVSYAAKWEETHVDYAGTKPVPLRAATPSLIAAIEATARASWHALGLRDFARVDLRVDAAGVPWVIDVNPNCDLSPDAGVARSARAAGMSYPQLIAAIAACALARGVP